MIRFVDSKGNKISEASEEMIIRFHDRTVINGYPFDCKEGDHVIVFSKPSFDKLQNNQQGQIEKLIKLNKECLEIAQESINLMDKRVDKLNNEKEELKLLNKRLSEEIQLLKNY